MENLTKLFDLLTDWRELPAYQLERRADIFFALYLDDLLKHCGYFAPDERLTIIPEFPAKHADSHQSDRIDYMVYSERKIVYVELKTDNRSIRSEQAEYLHNIQQKDLKEVFGNIISIYHATAARKKYLKLIEKLDRWIDYDKAQQVENRCTLRYDNIAQVESVKVVYILPTKDDRYEHRQICFDTPIYFDTLIEMLRLPEYADDPIAQAFADALAKWAEKSV
ncbi:MAG: hypothetical protein NC226_11905 [Bacteroides cellulosilyticus]|nr:hypothetical protein [Bacteroides cellulosilyticus]